MQLNETPRRQYALRCLKSKLGFYLHPSPFVAVTATAVKLQSQREMTGVKKVKTCICPFMWRTGLYQIATASCQHLQKTFDLTIVQLKQGVLSHTREKYGPWHDWCSMYCFLDCKCLSRPKQKNLTKKEN